LKYLKQGVTCQIVILKGDLGCVVPGAGKKKAARSCGGKTQAERPFSRLLEGRDEHE
jgi:hypothetical protein